jgi:50S ribosomal protein L16 3-hydroxylase
MDVKKPLPLLGGLSPEIFMAKHWQKKPLLIRGAVPGFKPLLSEDELLSMAQRDDVESRLVQETKSKARMNAKGGWKLSHGPFDETFKVKKQSTLLVQGVDAQHEAVHALLQQFRFVPDARLDDIMISLAGVGGGVGPHFDSYDVFLLQAAGRRRWQISAQKDLTLVEGAPLKILQNFKPTQEWVLEPGDMLYLPPRYAHDGVALDAGCQTYSIGFRAPRAGELARELLHRLADEIEDETLYADKAQAAVSKPGELPLDIKAFAMSAVAKALSDTTLVEQLIGEYLTEPKPNVWFEDQQRVPVAFRSVRLDRRTRMSYDAKHIYINGESFRAAGADARLMRKLADARQLEAADLTDISADCRSAIGQFALQGWCHVQR